MNGQWNHGFSDLSNHNGISVKSFECGSSWGYHGISYVVMGYFGMETNHTVGICRSKPME